MSQISWLQLLFAGFQSHDKRVVRIISGIIDNSLEVISFDFGSETSTNDTNFSCIIKDGLLNGEFSTNGNIVSAITEIEEGVFKLDASLPVSEDGRLELIHSSGSSIATRFISADDAGECDSASLKKLPSVLDELQDGIRGCLKLRIKCEPHLRTVEVGEAGRIRVLMDIQTDITYNFHGDLLLSCGVAT